MNRPIITRVDADASPPIMHLVFIDDEPIRAIDVRIRSPLRGREARVVAGMELSGFSSDQLQLLYDAASVVPKDTVIAELLRNDVEPLSTSARSGMIERVHQESRPTHMVFCPACACKLGHASSPGIGYVERCPSCNRRIRVRFADGAVTVEVRDHGGL
jgi:hypothetical protein